MIRYWILDGRDLVGATMLEWAAWIENGKRHVCDDYLHSERYGMIRVSTVCLGIEHVGGALFETMVFREKGTDKYGMPPPDDLVCSGFWGEMRRYLTFDEAESGHADIMQQITGLGYTPRPTSPADAPTAPKNEQ